MHSHNTYGTPYVALAFNASKYYATHCFAVINRPLNARVRCNELLTQSVLFPLTLRCTYGCVYIKSKVELSYADWSLVNENGKHNTTNSHIKACVD